MMPFEAGAAILESIPSMFMLLSLYLHGTGIFRRTLQVTPSAFHLIKQKDLIEYGILQLAVGAIASYLEGYTYEFFALILLVLLFIIVPYIIMTIVQGNRLGWVRSNGMCVRYVIMMLAISVGIRFLQFVLLSPLLLVALSIPVIISLGEYLRSN